MTPKLITVQDDGVLRIYPSVEDAVRNVEGLDAEDVFRSIFDETGCCYAIHWIRPNEYGRFSALSGVYTLIPDGRVDIAGLQNAINAARFIEPESYGPWIRELATRIARP